MNAKLFLAATGSAMMLAGCGGAPDNGKLADAEARAQEKAAGDGRIECALDGNTLFDRTCTVEEMTSGGKTILIVGRDDAGFRRLEVTTDGRGVVSADGAEAATVKIVADGMIEVGVGGDRYRLPAQVKAAS